jgi:hypothetical protein
VIAELKCLPTECEKACTSDNAANMLAAIPALTKEVSIGLGCADHLLNLVVQKSFMLDDEILDAVESFKSLSSRTHKSFQYKNRIRRECQKITNDQSSDGPVQYCKIIAPVETSIGSN